VKRQNSLFVHLGLLVLAAIAAVLVWTRDKAPKALAQSEVTVWTGRPADVERVRYDAKKKTIDLETKKDDAGRYFVIQVDKDAAAPAKKPDAGAEPEPAGNRTQLSIVSVGPGEKLLELVAPLKALRAVGKVAEDRLGEFGLDDPDGKLTIRVSGADRVLTVGAQTPGGGDRYVRFEGNGEVYVVKGDVVRDLEAAETKLIERDLHEWKDPDITSAKVLAGGKTRELLRAGPDGKRFWADSGAAEQNDETASNWMSKLERLRPSEFVLTMPEGKETVARVEYAARSRPLGFLELVKAPGPDGKAAYYVVSERTRHLAKVASSSAEQVEQDVASVVK
jgi:hypothetical protein